MSIPAKFTLFSLPIEVIETTDIKKEAGLEDDTPFTRGLCDPMALKIYIEKGNHPEYMLNTFYHELAHMMMHFAGRDDLYDNETFVQTLGGMLYEFQKTKDV